MLQNVAFRLVGAALLVSEVFLVSYLTYRWLGTVCQISRLMEGLRETSAKSMRVAKRFEVPQAGSHKQLLWILKRPRFCSASYVGASCLAWV